MAAVEPVAANTVKIILLGDSAVGKSKFVHRAPWRHVAPDSLTKRRCGALPGWWSGT